jgi:type I protein arginine methyltransferase
MPLSDTALPEHLQLGQFIPLHYHYQMLQDSDRMGAFEQALAKVVPPGGRVLDLGSGTGVLSFFAAQRASCVLAVEYNPALVATSREFLADNGVADRVTVVQADAALYTPDDPVDVVVCEMLHSALLREKQLQVIGDFKTRYRARFGTLPRFVPEATLLAAQPVAQSLHFHGYHARVPLFQAPRALTPDCTALAEPHTYAVVDYNEPLPDRFEATLRFEITHGGELTAVRFITKNLLAILPNTPACIEWHNQHLVLPLRKAQPVQAGETWVLSFGYRAGEGIEVLNDSLQLRRA